MEKSGWKRKQKLKTEFISKVQRFDDRYSTIDSCQLDASFEILFNIGRQLFADKCKF